MGTQRRQYAEAGRAQRDAIARMNALLRRPTMYRVLLAVFWLTATYSKTEDQTSLKQLTQLTFGLDGQEPTDAQYKQMREALKELHEEGIIERDAPGPGPPGIGDGSRYRVSLVPPQLGPIPIDPRQVQSEPESTLDGSTLHPAWGGNSPSAGGPSGKTSGKTPGVSTRACGNLDLARALIRSLPPDDVPRLEELVDQTEAQIGRERLAEVLSGVRGRFSWLSYFRKWVEREVCDQARRQPTCEICHDAGWRMAFLDDESNVAGRVPCECSADADAGKQSGSDACEAAETRSLTSPSDGRSRLSHISEMLRSR